MMASDNQFRISFSFSFFSFFIRGRKSASPLKTKWEKEPTKREAEMHGSTWLEGERGANIWVNRERGFGRGKAEDRARARANIFSE